MENDILEAKEMCARAREQLEEAKAQEGYIDKLTSRLIARAKENHFGAEIQVSFNPRNASDNT